MKAGRPNDNPPPPKSAQKRQLYVSPTLNQFSKKDVEAIRAIGYALIDSLFNFLKNG